MARQWHRPSVFAVVLTIFGIACFVALATWQFRRAQEKAELFAAFAHASEQVPVALDQARREATRSRYPRVRVAGRYDSQHAYVLDNQVRDGRNGIILFNVFEPADGSAPLLVNRGFLARGTDGAKPAIPAPPAGAQDLLALYAPPPGIGLRLGGNQLPQQRDWPKTGIYLDTTEIAQDLGRKVDSRVLLLEPEAGSPFVREWTPQVMPPQRHLGYAFTWLTFALVALVIFTGKHLREEGKQ